MKKILLMIGLGLFLGAATVNAAEMNTHHKNIQTEQKSEKTGTHKKGHKKGHKKSSKHTASANRKATQKRVS